MKSHRGLASVIGAVFLIAIVMSALSYITYSIEIMGNFSESLITEESRLKDKQREVYAITSIDITTESKLDVVIKNTGQIPLKITTLYIDEIGVNDVVNKTTIDKIIFPGSSFDFISESIDIDIDPTKGYNLKLITSRGETQTFYLNSASQEPLDIQLIALPEIIPTGFSTTLMMVVVNNMSSNNPLINLTPIEPTCSGICEKLFGPTPATYDRLNAGDVAIFEWSYTLDGDDGESVTFTSGIQNGFPGNTDSETVTIINVDISEVANQSISTLGFGQSIFADDLLVLHTETYGVPTAPPLAGPIPDPLRNYELNGDATDEQGGTDLQLLGTGGTLTSTGWDFTTDNYAQIVSGEIPDTEYAIEMVLSFDDVSPYPRILDFHNNEGAYGGESPDWGFYGYDNYSIEFWNFNNANGGSGMSDAILIHVLIQRTSSGQFEAYIDGSQAFTFDDTTNPEATFLGSAVDGEFTEQPATFFKDDSGFEEDVPGFVDCIRVWDTAFSSDDANTITSDSDTCYPFTKTISQLSINIPDQSGTTIVFDDTSDSIQWFSANVTVGETTIAAGVWNASLRYNSDRLPSGMAAGASSIHDSDASGGGHTLHFNTDATIARKDSGQMSACTSLVDNGSLVGATWGANMGVNGSGAYRFDTSDGVDYITIDHSTTLKACNQPEDGLYSIAGWFKGDVTASHASQVIFWKWTDTGDCTGHGSDDCGGFRVEIGDGNSAEHGVVFLRMLDKDAKTTDCKSDEPDGDGGDNYLDGNWHHFAAVEYAAGKCKLYMDGVEKDDTDGDADNKVLFEPGYDNDVYIGANENAGEGFTGYLDDIMFWNYYPLTASDVTALFGHSFGENSTRLNVYLNNATGIGTTDDVLASDENYGFSWVDPMTHTNVDDLWAGGNWTSTVSEVIMGIDAPYSRLNFTLSYASGAPLNLRVDDSNIDGTVSTLISSYLQVPSVDPGLPVFYVHNRDSKVTLLASLGVDEGVWFTYQGTRVIFNGTNGHYTGIVDTVNDGVNLVTVTADADSPFIDENVDAVITFWHPQSIPAASQPSENEKIPLGTYDVNIYLNGYDEGGTIFVRTISLGSIQVVDSG